MSTNVPEFFSLNFGSHSIKITQINVRDKAKVRLELLTSATTNLNFSTNDSKEGVQLLANEIKQIIKSANLKTKNCVMSVPENAIFSRLLTLPKVREEEVEEAIHWALKNVIPVAIEDVNIAYIKIDEKKVDANVFVNWYVVAAPRAIVDRYQSVIEKAELKILGLETESLAICRMIKFNYELPAEDNVMVIDLGAENTNIILSRNGIVTFSQTINTGSNAVTKIIASDFGLDTVQAERYKLTYGVDPTQAEGKIAKSMEPILQIIMGEVNRTLTYFREKIGGDKVTKVFLTGGGSGLLKLDEYIQKIIGIETLVVDPFKKIQMDGGMSKKLDEVGRRSFNVSVGLSLKSYYE